ncbi:MAG: RNA polymerase sigma factor [Ktedonobacterales bacterium]
MAWQDMFSGSATRINAEYEQELHLATQARLGADWALGALIARYQPTVTRYLTRLIGNALRAQQLSEQIFLRMERRLHGPHGGQHLRLWLLRSCTELGLDELRRPHHTAPRLQLSASNRRALLPELASGQRASAASGTDAGKMSGATDRIRASLGALADRTGTTGRQLRQLVWAPWSDPATALLSGSGFQQRVQARESENASNVRSPWKLGETPAGEEDILEPREVLRYRMIRAVLAELPYGDAQCLALHLIANLNQAEVARALGITPSATRRRIVSGLQLFSQRYEAASASLGISLEALEGGYEADEANEPFALPEDEAAAIPSYREPIVVSARLTDPLPLDISVTEETTIVWDLPPFADLAEARPSAPVSLEAVPPPAAVAEPVEESRAITEEEVTRRLMWSRPSAYRRTPVTSGEAVTTRLIRPSQSDDAGNSSSSASPSGSMAEVWTYTEDIETLTEPPPPALVVEAGEPVGTTNVQPEQARTVPILTNHAPPASIDDEEPASLGSSISDGEARVISVLTPASPNSSEDSQTPKGRTGPGDLYRPSAPSA